MRIVTAEQAEHATRRPTDEVFDASFANVQPHSGSQANAAVYMALLNPGDTVLGMSLAHGGHLTHGSPVNFSGRLYRVVSYGVDHETGRIDMDAVAAKARAEKPKMIVTGEMSGARGSKASRVWSPVTFGLLT